jgi:hypothetical protein
MHMREIVSVSTHVFETTELISTKLYLGGRCAEIFTLHNTRDVVRIDQHAHTDLRSSCVGETSGVVECCPSRN